MSLKKLIEINDASISAEHWYLAVTSHYHLKKSVRLTYIGFKSKQDRLDGKNPIPQAEIKFSVKNWKESKFDAQGIEKIINHNDYNKYVTAELKTALRIQARKHVRLRARNIVLADAVDD